MLFVVMYNMPTLNKIYLLTYLADMKSYKPLETAAILFSSAPFLKPGIS